MGGKKISHTHRSTMCGLKKLAAAETAETAAETDQKQ